ncbi:MAG: DNA methyltransferase [Gemmatimonadota bacterium]
MNKLYYGDNLDVTRRYLANESIDLVYLDPPFNSNQDYNVLFEEHGGDRSPAQIQVFEDTWHWDQAAAKAYEEVVEMGGSPSRALQAFRILLNESDMMAYLAMMAPRLVQLRCVLKDNGSLFLHCDPTASHYLKMLLDSIFGPGNFRNEIVWKRTTSHSDARQCGRVHDILLFYSKTDDYTWNKTFQPYDLEYVERYYRYQDKDGRRFMSDNLTGAGGGPPREFGEKGELAPPPGRHWMYDQEGIDRLLAEDRIFWTRNEIPRIKAYLDEAKGMPLQDVWSDIQALRSWHQERLGYPTQKPEALLERILNIASNPGETVLDPFCGCGTAVAVAHRLNRRWIGIDITHLAVNLIKNRLRDSSGVEPGRDYQVVGEPTDLSGAAALAQDDPYQFQWWALGLVGARPVEQKKGADRGIDGRLYFHDEQERSKTKQIILSVKAGKTGVSHLRDLRGVLNREDAEIGVLITMQEPTQPMRKEAASADFYESAWGKHSKLQILTVGELLDGAGIDYPPSRQVDRTFKKAPKARKAAEKQLEFGPDSN